VTSPADAVQLARDAVNNNRVISPNVAAGVLAAHDQLATDLAALQASVAAGEQYKLGKAEGKAEGIDIGRAEEAAVHAANPPRPAIAPPRQAPIRAEANIAKLAQILVTHAEPSRLPNDPPGEANGPDVIAVDRIAFLTRNPPAAEPAP
jgi:hypothetical protein